MRSAVVRSVCVAGIGFGSLIVLVDSVAPIPMPADPIAALSIALGAGVLAVWLPGTRWLRLGTVLIAVGALIVGTGYLAGGAPSLPARIAAAVFLGLALLCAVPGRPELGRLLNQTNARAVIRFQNFHAARIADELHDEVLQALAMTSRRLDSAARGGDARGLAAASRAAVEVLEDQAAVLRGIVGTLHPVTLRHVGVVAGIRELARQVAAANGLVVDVEVTGAPVAGLDDEIATVAYRVVQEALRNVVKHADARTVRVQVTCDRTQFAITVSDDGRGLPGTRPPAAAGYGLESMRWWCSAFGGDLSVGNRPGGGTRIRATFQTRGVSVSP
ncbi:ATP-binding protein [Amycolatopsis sp. FBCC-B4732]|uniref:sensor histidine kinase n=1 Tax=Amycolatopsis sp. FBCC-B4732 TaxID=3079339 RepID=UPI001FF477C1|nr:ATP-binding protein [Amycolatopsis sp. FBCC-B4732]UOX93054.1 ATP-binding protein [Amycolatopsis sp. FBCC-B4732]